MTDEEKIESAYRLIHDNLQWMPEEYCCWKKSSADGKVITKSLSSDYRPMYSFVRNASLRNNIAELRMCFDYHHSLYKLHKPGLLFGWQHKLVLGQIAAGICEGLLFDFFEYKSSQQGNKTIERILGKQKINQTNFGFGSLIDIFHQTEDINEPWYVYLTNLKHVRDTVHPKSLNAPNAGFKDNHVVRGNVDTLVKNLDKFTKNMERKY